MSIRFKSWRRTVATAGMLAVALSGMPLVASGHSGHFGSNWGHICDDTPDSQCKADGATHRVFRAGLESDQQSAIAWAISNVYTFAATDLTMLTVTQFDGLTDVGVTDASYGSTGDWAWTACADDAVYGGSEASHTRWCRSQDLFFNPELQGGEVPDPG